MALALKLSTSPIPRFSLRPHQHISRKSICPIQSKLTFPRFSISPKLGKFLDPAAKLVDPTSFVTEIATEWFIKDGPYKAIKSKPLGLLFLLLLCFRLLRTLVKPEVAVEKPSNKESCAPKCPMCPSLMMLAKCKVAVEKASKESGAPKRPMCPFLNSMEDFSKSFKENHPDIESIAAVEKAGGEECKSMSETDKAPYVAMAKLKKDDSETALKECKQKTAGNAVEMEKSEGSVEKAGGEKCKSMSETEYLRSSFRQLKLTSPPDYDPKVLTVLFLGKTPYVAKAKLKMDDSEIALKECKQKTAGNAVEMEKSEGSVSTEAHDDNSVSS